MAPIILVFLAICAVVYTFYQKSNRFKYWERKGVKGPKPHWFYGNFKTIIQKQDSIHNLVGRIYNEYPTEKFIGVYSGSTPILIIKDPELIKHVFIKDFSSFVNRGATVASRDPLNQMIFFKDGNEWRVYRQRLSPIFTTGKLKQMMPLLNKCVKEYTQYLDKIVNEQNPHEFRNLKMKYTLKAITTVAFGLNIDTFANEENEFTHMAELIFEPSYKSKVVAFLKALSPALERILGIQITRQEVLDFFRDLVIKIIRERQGKPKTRKDFMDFMIELKEEGIVTKAKKEEMLELEITDEIMIAEALEFYAAGFETTSGTLSFLFYELALNPKIQERCYVEIKEVLEKYNGELPYDALPELQYVAMVFDETLRKYPIVHVLNRECTEKYQFPGFTIERGTKILIPVPSLQNDPKYYPDPETFDPERFAPENRVNIQDSPYFPFGDGPRNCIGLRFAKVQSYLGIAHFLYNYRVEPSERTVEKISYNVRHPVLKSIDGIWLNIKRRQRIA